MDIRRRFLNNITSLPSGGEDTTGAYTVNLNDNWRLSTNVKNPDTAKYEGVYESFSNYNVNNGTATMTITLNNLDEFTLYIRSYAESGYDYVCFCRKVLLHIPRTSRANAVLRPLIRTRLPRFGKFAFRRGKSAFRFAERISLLCLLNASITQSVNSKLAAAGK